MPTDLAKVKELFFAVLELSAAERAAHLDTACAGDSALREQVEALLQSHENSGELLPRSPAEMLRERWCHGGGGDGGVSASWRPIHHHE